MEAGHPVALVGEHVRSGCVDAVNILAIRPEQPDGFCKGPTGLQGQCDECAKSGVSLELAGEQMGRREARLAPDEKRPGRIFERRFKIAESGRCVFGLETEGNGYAHVCEVVAVAQVGGVVGVGAASSALRLSARGPASVVLVQLSGLEIP